MAGFSGIRAPKLSSARVLEYNEAALDRRGRERHSNSDTIGWIVIA